MKTLMQPAAILRFNLLAGVVSLAAAFTAQYGYGLAPCHLCLAQRVPFALVIILSIAGLLKPRWWTGLIMLIGILFIINSGIAGYHTAVEQHWISGPSGCTQEGAPASQSDEDFLKRIQNAPIVACDQPAWDFYGITMAQMNVAWSLFLGIATFCALQQSRRREKINA